MGRVGFGIIIRDCEGNVLASSAQAMLANFSPQLAEAMAFMKGIQFAYDSGLWPCLCESNVLAIVNLVRSNDPIFAENGTGYGCSLPCFSVVVVTLFLLFLERPIWLLVALPRLGLVMVSIASGWRIIPLV
ncbi:hypothetical protein LWI28_015046 [Acer negundo]|uniref:RNase H type-1 domain-containing protein n=1 Tax=Acer negundo TaxID=4023 RepID=A0AAD5IEA2_ACENE|nr:hypothetical protein LWI28_015046 [Acer negundo]